MPFYIKARFGCSFLVPFCQLCFVFVGCVHSRVVESSWEGIAGCVVHVDVHGGCVCCGWMQCGCSQRGLQYLTEVDQ